MDNSSKKVFKKTSSAQFDVLVKELEKNPDLAKGAPMFGASKSLVELQWNELANKLNAHGPPQRTATEWKKIWADLKSRTKKKIAENASSMHATGGGPFRLSTGSCWCQKRPHQVVQFSV
ncbi:nuclear apoptosis-inducing factor 1-like [Rhagoletis pomonella]|uniref:nuclear apoptosis-inducing factor 1-like n=1 Tax=Rhagoletis pomonella TaxID=28610 RepID=UPI00177EF92A|nr:nuclear apoptosis-inducing factor 1-like [Rhagoletis pomonella]